MRRLLFILPLLWVIACTGFDPVAAEEEIARLVTEEQARFDLGEISIDLAIPDSVAIDSAWVVTRITLNTTFSSESLGVEFNKELHKDTVRTIGDTAIVQILREYTGNLTSTIEPAEGGSAKDVVRNFNSLRTQWARFADEKGWGMIGYSFAEERADTNLHRIYYLVVKGSNPDTIRSSATISTVDSFPVLTAGSSYDLLLRTTADTNDVVCFAVGSQVVRFVPSVNVAEDWTDRWEASVTMDNDPLILGVVKREALGDESYPADFSLWIIPLTE